MKLFTLLFLFLMTAQAQIKPADQQYMQGENYLLNAGFESGRTSWTESGTATDTLESSIVRFGLQSLKIVSSAQTVNLSQIITKYSTQSAGQQGLVSAWIKSTSAIAQVCAVVDSVDVKCVTIEANNTWKEYVIPFIMGATNNGIRIKSASDSATTYIDNAFVGVMPATMMPEISQAQIAGESYFPTAANCQWSRTSTALGAFSADTDCVAPVIVRQNLGQWQTTDLDLPRQVINNLPAGEYKVTYIFPNYMSASAVSAFAIHDGTTTCAAVGGTSDPANASLNTVSCIFNYSSAGNRSFEIYVASATATALLPNSVTTPAFGVKFILEYYPPKSKIYSGDTIYPHAQLLGKLNYATAANCTWSITGTIITNFGADTDCANPTVTGSVVAPSTKIPAVVLPAGSPRGTYKFEASGSFYGVQSTLSLCGYRFNDGSNSTALSYIGNTGAISGFSPNIIGEIEYSSALTSNTTVQIQAREYDGNALRCDIESGAQQQELTISVYYFPPKDNPIVGTFAGIEKCSDAYECTDVFSAKVSSAGVVSAENLDWINGNCVVTSISIFTCTFNSSIFTVAPNCVGTIKGNPVSNFNINSVSSTQVVGYTYNTTPASDFARDFEIICQKQGSDYKPKTAKAATTNEMMYVPNIVRPKTCYYAFGGASATLASPTNCTASPCVEVYDSCSAGTPPTRGNTGLYEGLAFANGTWKANVPIKCSCAAYASGAATSCFNRQLSLNTWSTSASGGYSTGFLTNNNSPLIIDSFAIIECTADAP